MEGYEGEFGENCVSGRDEWLFFSCVHQAMRLIGQMH